MSRLPTLSKRVHELALLLAAAVLTTQEEEDERNRAREDLNVGQDDEE